jgi:hypothetical protein
VHYSIKPATASENNANHYHGAFGVWGEFAVINSDYPYFRFYRSKIFNCQNLTLKKYKEHFSF